ncbi:SDR family oxidoreductase [Spongiibacter sp. KMU-166]|uniref:SDR family oxidoreductase n=1 Tax=Spongiibacter thalassae TaxID=2721624 RepID=A0ABX1GKK1_9GAMM|nr:SDR family NAD(P)-dependent oxidoreductase [Spongiibacter thalassae]NKI18684.1 SDR family oxidoreductase [Spongiibacter thalassae]
MIEDSNKNLPRYDFSGKVALVTGGASGIGAAAVKRFAQSGAEVIIADINGSAAADYATAICAEGGTAVGYGCDVSDEAQVKNLIAFAVETFGGLDYAFNNAGIIGFDGNLTGTFTAENWTKTLEVNLTGVFNCLKHELAYMAEHGGGSIVNNSSSAGLFAAKAGAAYGATKHGVIGLTKTAAKEYLAKGIRVNAVCPGGVATPLLEDMVGMAIPEIAPGGEMPAIAAPEHIADAVMWLSSPASAFVIGQAMLIDGGTFL